MPSFNASGTFYIPETFLDESNPGSAVLDVHNQYHRGFNKPRFHDLLWYVLIVHEIEGDIKERNLTQHSIRVCLHGCPHAHILGVLHANQCGLYPHFRLSLHGICYALWCILGYGQVSYCVRQSMRCSTLNVVHWFSFFNR